MKRYRRKIITFFLLVSLFILAPFKVANATTISDEVTDVPTDKVWTITFNYPVIESSITENSIYIMNSHNERMHVKLEVNGKIVKIHPPEAGYGFNEKYTIHISDNILGQIGDMAKPLKTAISKPFITTKGYAVVNLNTNGTHSVANYTDTFDKANTTLQAGQGIMLNGRYLKMPAGFVATKSKSVTVLYKQPSFTAGYEYTGVSPDTELLYMDATEKYVKVQAAGQEMYVKQEDVTLIPSTIAKGQSYYIADHKGLWHRIYHHLSGNYDAAYLVGKKPSFMNVDEKYYSTDGATYTDADGNVVGESYSYFQYLSPRVTTKYSADELDKIIDKQLEEREKTGQKEYANATAKSPLKGLGDSLKAIEQEYHTNALLILAMAIHESNYGMSCHAQNYNNLFGLNVTDTNTECSSNVDKTNSKYFETIEENIAALVNRLNTSYLDPLNMGDYRYNGAALGNKMIGMNVRYASDPYWGAKIAGHMFRLDQELYSKDYKKYQIAITTGSQVSIRKEPIIQSGNANNIAYQYKLDWTIKRLDKMPITISNTPSQTVGWHRVISELQYNSTDLYTVYENVRIVTTH